MSIRLKTPAEISIKEKEEPHLRHQ